MTDQETAILAFEGLWWRYAGHKEQAIRGELGLSAVRYYQILVVLIQTETALAYAPVTVNRLRRIAGSRAAVRCDVA